MSRYFVIEDETFKPGLEAYRDAILTADRNRNKFFTEWGSKEYYGTHQEIEAVRDPRVLNPEVKLPKGWRKMRSTSDPGYVEPSNNETKALVKSMNMPLETKITAEIMNRIYAGCPDYKHMVPFSGDKEVWYFCTIKGRQCSCFPVIMPFIGADTYVFCIPDPTIKIDTIPGCREIKEWEYLKMKDEHEAWIKEQYNLTSKIPAVV